MKILIINIDSKKMPNLALKKIEKYHIDKGDEVMWDMPLAKGIVDKIYVSCIFSKNHQEAMQYYEEAEIGGTGFNDKIKLPSYIEKLKPHINLGFTTRGCIRKCEFCIVPSKEGNIKIVGDLLDLWDGKSKKITLLDNNILAVRKHFKKICKQARDHKIGIDFNQGLDCRLLDQEIMDELKSIRRSGKLRFAFDNISYFDDVKKAINLLDKNNIYFSTWYVLTGFNTTLEEDLFKINYLRSRDQRPYVMRFNNSKKKELISLASWVNRKYCFKVTWEEFLMDPRNKRFAKYIDNNIDRKV